ncbi:MAG TPA: sigma-54 dependent transcriptional regulator [Bacteroidota bacterium]|nr:sigma-54 dependent transcriptional regulator [Bacteroidota bacterium]
MHSNIFPSHPILFVDDEEQYLLSLELTMSSNGITNIATCSDSRRVMDILAAGPCSLVVLDINMPHVSGAELLPVIVERYPDLHVIVVTALNDVESAVRCMRLGAYDYVLKPADDARLVTAIRRGLELDEVRSENEMLKASLLRADIEHPGAFSDIISRSHQVQSLFRYCEAVGSTRLPILITGETGTGKELFARAIHAVSGRPGGLVTVNVAGVDDTFFADTLFGHRKGAFTGAESDRKGLIDQAEDGTLFLDEIGDLRLESQVKLLRLLQDGQYYPLGSDVARLSNARIIVATHRDIRGMQESGTFRKDLYYRLKSHHINIPPLRERSGDVPYLVDHFITKAAAELGRKRPTVPKELFTLLKNYDFPGNVRELQGMITDAVSIHASGILSLDSIRRQIADSSGSRGGTENRSADGTDDEAVLFPGRLPTLEEADDALIREALRRAENNQTIAAELLGLSRRALNNRLRRKGPPRGA